MVGVRWVVVVRVCMVGGCTCSRGAVGGCGGGEVGGCGVGVHGGWV